MFIDDDADLRREAAVMALYVATCLLATLIAVDDADHGRVRAFALVWGTTVGLALAHAFAFSVSAQLASGESFGRAEALHIGAQVMGAFFIAAISTVPLLLVDPSAEFDVVRVILAVVIGGFGYETARLHGANRFRRWLYGGGVLFVAATVALIKNILSGH